jgi:hypothetical protein
MLGRKNAESERKIPRMIDDYPVVIQVTGTFARSTGRSYRKELAAMTVNKTRLLSSRWAEQKGAPKTNEIRA